MKSFRAIASLLLIPVVLMGCVSKSSPPPTRAGAFATGQYRNLFVEAGQSPAAVTAKIEAAFQQLFYGDPRTEAVYYPAGTNAHGALAYILDVHNRDVRSEGMSYGMMIAVQLDRKAEFDALWNWSRTFMYHTATNHPAHGYFAWSMTTNGIANDEMPAPDGEAYFATALQFASSRWGEGEGIYQYRAEAERILTDLIHRERITGTTGKGQQTAVAIFHPEHKMIRFTPDVENSERTDASYHLPAFYELWARFGPERDRDFWKSAAAVSRDYFYRAAHPTTGLTSEYGNFDGTPWVASWNQRSGDFVADAWRTAMNWSMDWAWWAADPRQQELSDRIQSFFISQGITNHPSRFTLDGQPLGSGRSVGLVAMNATASLAATHPNAQQFVTEFWNAPVPSGQFRYYDGMLYLLGLLHCSGEFRIWLPN
jgi:oligosaccharide reducing-end xylanase